MDIHRALGRWVAGHHDAADVVAGAAFGLFVGLLTVVQARGAPDVWYRATTLGMAMAVLLVLLLRRRRGQAERAAMAALQERLAIARDLHDVVAHHVSLMGIQAGVARRALARDATADAAEALSVVESSGRAAVDELRRLLLAIRMAGTPAPTLATPGLDGIGALVSELRAAGQDIVLEQAGERPEITPGVDKAAYRIVQEALTNARRHAAPGRVTLRVRYTDTEVEIEVANPIRPHLRDTDVGFGLVGMRERAALFGGTVEAGPDGSGAFRVLATLPLEVTAP